MKYIGDLAQDCIVESMSEIFKYKPTGLTELTNASVTPLMLVETVADQIEEDYDKHSNTSQRNL